MALQILYSSNPLDTMHVDFVLKTEVGDNEKFTEFSAVSAP
jgi:hypothetical protein